ncbi:tyrosine-type recombinase/integrase [Luteipulveratus mongoliensis]|uniref:Tyr recombinase domain-containing protein n=1 Tax=Luteipulveratus mongoliensis TaxID=571913 RepID=A0A0K1JIQ6_9MICO|nr:site-specific integrase [Luteipulveratus mongoliensis]AKU16586.1 hypothetical protein VV02_13160 [Luteipulveratus mongoliensis]
MTTTPLRNVDGKWRTLPKGTRKVDGYRARIGYRDHSGVIGEVSKRAPTKIAAERAALQEIRERLAGESAHLTGRTLVVDACRQWLDEMSREGARLSARTVAEYEGAYRRCVAGEDSPIRALTLVQVNDAQRLQRWLQWVADERGVSAVKHAKAVMSAVLVRGVRYRVLPTNELRQVEPVTSGRAKRETDRDTSRAFTAEEQAAVLAFADSDGYAAAPGLHYGTERLRRSVSDLAHFLAGTGVRIGEALSIRWEHVDLKTGRVEVPGTKTDAAQRTLTLPNWLRERMSERAAREGTVGLVFSAPRLDEPEAPWDPSNCSKAFTTLMRRAGHPWARSHSLRKTVATRLAEAGQPVQRVSDQLGHKDAAFTARTYLGRSLHGDKADLAALL